MATVTESILVEVTLAEAWDHYFLPRGWSTWVDGFASVAEIEGYPEVGGRLLWRSTPAGRGTVTERVLAHQPRRLHRIEFSDPASQGELLTRFEVEAGAVRLTLVLRYRLEGRRGPFSRLTDRLFIRGQLRGSLRRSLTRFKHEAEEVAALAADPRATRSR